MRCPNCGYNSFDYLEECRKCGAALSPVPVFRYLYEGEFNRGADSRVRNEGDGRTDDRAEKSRRYEGIDGEIEDLPGFFSAQSVLSEEKSETSESENPALLTLKGFAFFVDFLFTICVAVVALVCAAKLIGETSFPEFSTAFSIWGRICLGVYFLSTTYFVIVPHWCGTTLGNSVVGIRVVTQDGSRVGLSGNMVRWFGWIFSVSSGFLGFAPALFDAERRTLSDRLSGTLVIKT